MSYFTIYNIGPWNFSLIYLIFSFGLWFIFPSYVKIRFIELPDIGKLYYFYVFIYLLLLVSSLFGSYQIDYLFFIGVFIFLVGISAYISALFFFSINEFNKPVTTGTYSISRHPVYFSFLIIFIGIAVLSCNIFILFLDIILFIIALQIAKKEEEICLNKYGIEYQIYMDKVNRIFGRKW